MNRKTVSIEIENFIREKISSGNWTPGMKIPSHIELSKILNVNPNTVGKVYRNLDEIGVLNIRRGLGTFVVKNTTAFGKANKGKKEERKISIAVINGPNLNMLGIREPSIYGTNTYSDLENRIKDFAFKRNIDVSIFQSNYEGDLISEIQKSYGKFDGIIINPAGYTHTSIAIKDAIRAVNLPTIEVHISDINKREDFRKTSMISDECIDTIAGEGFDGYGRAMDILLQNIEGKESNAQCL